LHFKIGRPFNTSKILSTANRQRHVCYKWPFEINLGRKIWRRLSSFYTVLKWQRDEQNNFLSKWT